LAEVVVEVTRGPENAQAHGDTTRDKKQATHRRSPETEAVRSNRQLVIKEFIRVSSERWY
jgi:hypothetical protein